MSNNVEKITKWVKIALGIDNCTVEIEGSNALGEGYLSDITFVKASSKTGEEENLVIKVCKSDPGVKEMTKAYTEREMFFYEEIMPTLLDFQKEKNVKQPFTAFSKCYKVFRDEDIEVFVLENLKKRGYTTLHRSAILEVDQLKFVLKNYARFHALSLALRDQRRDVFDKLEQRCHNFLPEAIKAFDPAFKKAVPKVEEYLKEAGRPDLAEKYRKLMAKGPTKMSIDAYSDVPKETVIGHGDCHTGNMLIKYKDGSKTNLQEIALVDFQVVNIHSPILDVTSVIMTMTAKIGLSRFKELMEHYHQELSSFLAELSSDADEIFPESAMWKHWAKYSIATFVMLSSFMEIIYSDDISNFAEVMEVNSKMSMSAENRVAFLERLTAVADFYLNNDN